mgnify:CR=1 FL=1
MEVQKQNDGCGEQRLVATRPPNDVDDLGGVHAHLALGQGVGYGGVAQSHGVLLSVLCGGAYQLSERIWDSQSPPLPL